MLATEENWSKELFQIGIQQSLFQGPIPVPFTFTWLRKEECVCVCVCVCRERERERERETLAHGINLVQDADKAKENPRKK